MISEALSALPAQIGDDLVTKAEAYLVEQAAELGPRDLRNLGRGVLHHLAPDVADGAEYQALLAAEDRASAATRLSLRRRGDGSTDGTFRIPDSAAGRMRAYLNAVMSPRRLHLETPFGPAEDTAPDEFADLPLEHRQGVAFVALLEHVPPTTCPSRAARRPPSWSPSTTRPCAPTSVPPASWRPRPVISSRPGRLVAWRATPASCPP